MNSELTNYLKSIGKIPMLTQEDEFRHAKLVFDSRQKIVKTIKSKKSLDRLLQAIESIDSDEKTILTQLILSITPEKLPILRQSILLSDFDVLVKYSAYSKRLTQLIEVIKKSREILITSNLRLVISIAKYYSGSNADILDLIQEGGIGLIKAVDKFDYRRGTRLSTVAVWWCRQGIIRSLSNKSRLIRMPVHIIDSLNKAYTTLFEKFGRAPTAEEIKASMKISFDVAEIRDIMAIMTGTSSIDSPINNLDDDTRNPVTHEALLKDPNPLADELIADESVKRLILKDIATLSAREEKILRLKLSF